MKIPALTALTFVLSILAAPVAQAGGRVLGSDFHNGAATNGRSQGQNGGHVHNDGGKVVSSDF